MKAPQEILTERLRLTPIAESHRDFLFSYASDPMVNKYTAWKAPRTKSDTDEFIFSSIAGWEDNSDFNWIIADIKRGTLLGAIELIPGQFSAKFGYVIAPEFWGKGYATEAASAVVNIAESDPNIFRLWTVCDVENKASARVLEKLGFQLEGILRRWAIRPNLDENIPGDCFCFSRVKYTV